MIEIAGHSFSPSTIIAQLEPLMTPQRLATIDRVVDQRTEDVLPILENIYDRGNVSAVMRTGEAFGIAQFCLIDSVAQKFKAANRVTQGADKWLKISQFHSATEAVPALKKQGYQVWATSLTEKSVSIELVPFDQKVAFILGNEKDGVSAEALSLCDGNFLIPMLGFSQSFNISVAGALIFHQAYRVRTAKRGQMGSLTSEQKLDLKARYLCRSLGSAEQILLRSLKM